jgi:hypothetical protein
VKTGHLCRSTKELGLDIDGWMPNSAPILEGLGDAAIFPVQMTAPSGVVIIRGRHQHCLQTQAEEIALGGQDKGAGHGHCRDSEFSHSSWGTRPWRPV